MGRKVCFFLGSLELGGIGKLSINLMEEFIKKDVTVDVFLMKAGGEYTGILPKEVNVYCVEGSWVKRVSGFLKYLYKSKPEVSLSARQRQDVINIICCLLTFSKVTPVVSVHTHLTAERTFKGQPSGGVVDKIAAILYKFVNKIIAVSNGVADDFSARTGVDRNKVKVIYNPVYKEITDFGVGLPVFEEFYKRYSKFVIGVGRLTVQKDFQTLIRAFAQIKGGDDFGLVIAGDGPLKKDLEALVNELELADRVLFLGFVNNPLYYVKKSRLFVLSSKWEGFGNVIVEALGVGTSVVSTDCKSGPAEILENGRYGQLVPVGDVNALSNAIERELLNPRNGNITLIERARDYDYRVVSDKYLEALFEKKLSQ